MALDRVDAPDGYLWIGQAGGAERTLEAGGDRVHVEIAVGDDRGLEAAIGLPYLVLAYGRCCRQRGPDRERDQLDASMPEDGVCASFDGGAQVAVPRPLGSAVNWSVSS
jgi:hypothetical protein